MKDLSKNSLNSSLELPKDTRKSDRNTLTIITVLVAIVIIVGLAVLVLFRLGLIYNEPAVTVQADNCYDETITVAMDYDYAPFSYRSSDGTPTGHDVELINEIANRLKKNVDIRFLTYSECLAQIRSGEVDVVMSTTFEEELDSIRNSIPVVSNAWIAFSKGDVMSIADLYGKRIGIIAGADPLKDFGLYDACRPFPTYTDGFEKLENGELDCVIAKYPIGRKIIRDNGFIDIKATCEVTGSHLSIGMNADNVILADQVDGIIRELSTDGFLKSLNEKWCGKFVSDFSLKDFIEYYPGLFILSSMALLLLFCLLIITLINRRNDRLLQNRMEAARDEKEAELKEQMARVMGLSEDFQAIFDVDTETGRYDIFSYDTAYFDDVLVKMEKGSDFYADTLKDVEKVVYPDDRDLIRDTFSNKEYIKKTLAEQGQFTIDYRLMGEKGPVWYRVKVVKKAGDDSRFLVGVFYTDERIRKEAEYVKSIEDGLKVIGGLASDCVSLYTLNLDDDSYNVYSITDEANEIRPLVDRFGNFSAALRQYADEFVHEEDREKLYRFTDPDHVREALRDTRSHKVLVRRNFDGEWEWIEMNLIKTEPVDQPAKNVILSFTNRDLQVREEEGKRHQLEEALDLASYANQAKTAFLNSMSHDIRTPMNAITGYTRMAEKNIGDAKVVKEYLDKIELSGQQLLSLINQVLEMSRIESGKVVLSEEPVDIVEKAYAIQTVTGADVEKKGLNYTTSVKHIKHRHVLTDDSRMTQVITNIMGNAIKYTPEGGTIDYTVEELPCDRKGFGLFRFTVADTGIGMSGEYLEHIFDEFSRENTSTVSHIQGTGLGMSIVKKLVDLMNGKIDVQSEPGKGTTIAVTIPMKLDDKFGTQEEKEKVYKKVNFSGKRLLLVEDNEMNREIAGDLLKEAGFIVETAEDGDIAVEMVKKVIESGDYGYYAAVLMDIQMPRMNGYEATKAIRELKPVEHHVPIIAVSANAFEEDRQKSLAAGMDEHVAKPIDVQKLKEALAKLL